jgi:hypothetical protein
VQADSSLVSRKPFIRDLAFALIIGVSARYAVNNTIMAMAVSTLLSGNDAEARGTFHRNRRHG